MKRKEKNQFSENVTSLQQKKKKRKKKSENITRSYYH